MTLWAAVLWVSALQKHSFSKKKNDHAVTQKPKHFTETEITYRETTKLIFETV